MKKSIIALAVLTATAGVAQAATSVTMYGRVDVGYNRTTGDVAALATKNLMQTSAGENRFGIKGNEDLGGELAATFQLEGRFDGDTGAKTAGRDFFDRESTIGLKGSLGHVRLGRSLAAMERGIGFINVGNRSADISPYSSAARYSNGLFYDFAAGDFSAGANVTTKDGATGNTDELARVTGKVAFGGFLGYKVGGLRLGAAYQRDNAVAGMTKETGVGVSYAAAPVMMGASYSVGKNDGSDTTSKIAQAYLGTYLTASDLVGIRGIMAKADTAGTDVRDVLSYGLGYNHAVSKRTSIYANLIQRKDKLADTKTVIWDLAVRHNF